MLMTHNFWNAWERAFDHFEEPLTTAQEREDDFVLSARLPGVDPKDVELTVTHDSVKIAAKRQVKPVEGYTALRRERADFDFSRAFALPRHIDTEKVVAEFKDGVLTVTAPKADTAKPRRITVKGA